MKSKFTTIFLVLISLILSIEAKAESSVEAIIIEQPNDVIECEGSLDQYLFVVAAPSQKQYKIAYRWLKDGRPISTWVADFGQLTFDTLRYRMSGLYNAELFAYDPNWTSSYGNSFSYDSARVSPIISSETANLYVLQPPSFMKDIEYQIVKKGDDCIFTFDANIYGEHNMDDPTYWTDIQWFKDSVALIDGDRISGSQSSILTINNIKETDYSTKYSVRLSSDCDTIWSNEFAVDKVPDVSIKSYTYHMNDPICSYFDMYYSVRFTTLPNYSPLEFQWFINDKPVESIEGKYIINTFTDSISNYTDVSIESLWNEDIEPIMKQSFYCEVWPKGFKENKITTRNIKGYWHKPIKLIKDLENEYTVEEGKKLKFGVKAESNSILYSWYKDDKSLGGTSDSVTIVSAELRESGIYQLKMRNACGEIWSKKTKVTVAPKQTITGIKDNSTDQEISIYPNPLTSNSTLTISPGSSGEVYVMLVDLLGNKLANIFDDNIQLGQNESIKLNTDNIGLSSGTYYLIIQMGDKVETRQVSIVK